MLLQNMNLNYRGKWRIFRKPKENVRKHKTLFKDIQYIWNFLTIFKFLKKEKNWKLDQTEHNIDLATKFISAIAYR